MLVLLQIRIDETPWFPQSFLPKASRLPQVDIELLVGIIRYVYTLVNYSHLFSSLLYGLILKGKKKSLFMAKNTDPHQHARSNDCLKNFLTLNTQLLIQSVSKEDLCIWESSSLFLDCKTKMVIKFRTFRLGQKAWYVILSPCLEYTYALDVRKRTHSPLMWAVTFQCPRNKKGAFLHWALFS